MISLEAQIAQLQSTLDALVLARQERNASILAHKRALSVVRRIPPELVSKIFLQCAPESHTHPRYRILLLSFLLISALAGGK